MGAPQRLDVLPYCGAKGAKVVKAGDAAIDLKGGKDEEFALEEVLDFLALVFLGEILTSQNRRSTFSIENGLNACFLKIFLTLQNICALKYFSANRF